MMVGDMSENTDHSVLNQLCLFKFKPNLSITSPSSAFPYFSASAVMQAVMQVLDKQLYAKCDASLPYS